METKALGTPRPPRTGKGKTTRPDQKRTAQITADAEVVREALRRFPLFQEPKPMKVGIRKELIRYCLAVSLEYLETSTKP